MRSVHTLCDAYSIALSALWPTVLSRGHSLTPYKYYMHGSTVLVCGLALRSRAIYVYVYINVATV